MGARMIGRAAAVTALLLCISAAQATVEIETVPVGDPGNAGELSGNGAGGMGRDRICGAVHYEYRVGKYEVTAGQYAAFLNAVAGVDKYGLYSESMPSVTHVGGITRSGGGTVEDPYAYAVDPACVNRPVTCVNWGDAARFANWLHNGQPAGAQDASTTEDGGYDLSATQAYYGPNGETPSYGPDWEALIAAIQAVTREPDWKWAITNEDEWHKAAYYDPLSSAYYDYPTGSDTPPGRDMTEITSPGNNANYVGGEPYPMDPPHYTTVAGEFELSHSPYGTFDQGGNVLEWTETIVVGLFESYHHVRGGSSARDLHALAANHRTIGATSTGESAGIGFCVVQVPEPAVTSPLAVGGAWLLRRRRGHR